MSFITQGIKPRNIPRTLAEAKASPEWPEWEKAIKAEMDILGEMEIRRPASGTRGCRMQMGI
jgi:hypothetical protein